MLDLELTVTYTDNDEPAEVVRPSVAALVRVERHYGKPAAELFTAPGIELLARVAFEGGTDRGRAAGFDAWLETVADIDTGTAGPLSDAG